MDKTLKFSKEIENNNICFLDLKISVQNNHLETTVYRKPTDCHLYLEASSCHKKSSKNGIIKYVALRLRRICSTIKDFKIKPSEYIGYLVVRGHSPKLVKSEFGKVSSLFQNMPLHKK